MCMSEKKECWVVDCGEMEYLASLELQKKLVTLRSKGVIPDVLLLLEHPPVITMGLKATESMLRIPKRILEQRGIPVYNVSRGGKVTFHGPGQVIGYAIRAIPLEQLDNHMNGLEDTMLRTLSDYKVDARKSYIVDSNKRLPGAWTFHNKKECKLGSVGVEVRTGVTMHGFALNVNIALDQFDLIDMCGFKDKYAISMRKILDKPLLMSEVKTKLASSFADVFSYRVEKKSFLSFMDAVNKSLRAIPPEKENVRY